MKMIKSRFGDIEMAFEIDAYLARIGLSAEPQTNEQGLHQLQNAQFFSIPFENLDGITGT